jgi:hypothetical protein
LVSAPDVARKFVFDCCVDTTAVTVYRDLTGHRGKTCLVMVRQTASAIDESAAGLAKRIGFLPHQLEEDVVVTGLLQALSESGGDRWRPC